MQMCSPGVQFVPQPFWHTLKFVAHVPETSQTIDFQLLQNVPFSHRLYVLDVVHVCAPTVHVTGQPFSHTSKSEKQELCTSQ